MFLVQHQLLQVIMILWQPLWLEKEQQTTLTNIIMELSFITEGSIPFAASDPLHILPACVVGSIVGMFGLALLKKPLK